MIELPGLWSLTPIGFGIGVVALMYWLLVTGRLVPRSLHDRIVATQTTRGDEWKDTALEARKTTEVQATQITDLVQANKVVEQLLRASGPHLGDSTQGGPS